MLSGLSINGHQALGVTKCSDFIEFARIQGTSEGHWAELIFSENFCMGLLLDREKKLANTPLPHFP